MHLHKLALDIFYTLKDSNIEMEIEWISRTLSERADYLSRIIDPDYMRVKDHYFQLLQVIAQLIVLLVARISKLSGFILNILILILWGLTASHLIGQESFVGSSRLLD